MNIHLCLLWLSLSFTLSFLSSGQEVTINGYIRDGINGEEIIGANVSVKEVDVSMLTNEYGYYSLRVPRGRYTLLISFVGMKDKQLSIEAIKNQKIDIELEPLAVITQTVTIQGSQANENVESTNLGTLELSSKTAKELPALLGEVDILKTMQLLPGIQSAGEGSGNLYIRGGGPDQNLFLLDNATVYNTGHLFGFLSVFNADAIKNTKIIKGGMPANYGGRISSVVDISMKEGSMKKISGEGGLGLISSRLSIHGPFKKDKASFLISVRGSYVSLLFQPILKRIQNGRFSGNNYYFYDLNAKFNIHLSEKDRLFVSGYYGRDVFRFQQPNNGSLRFDLPWGNGIGSVRWNRIINEKIFMNLSLIFTDYNFRFSGEFQNTSIHLNSSIRDYGGKLDFSYFPNSKHIVKFGFAHTFHILTPYVLTSASDNTDFSVELQKRRSHEMALYILDDFKINKWLKINYGLRFSTFTPVGPFREVRLNNVGMPIDTTTYRRFAPVVTYAGVEPRLATRFKIKNHSSIKLGLSLNRQYLHLVSSSTSTLPIDIWTPSSRRVRPQWGIQYSLGYFGNYKSNMFEFSVEAYYKDLRNLIEYGQSNNRSIGQELEQSFVFGRGYATGVEFFFKVNHKKVTSWVAYTLAYSNKIFPELNEGKPFPSKYDRRHDASFVLMYKPHKRWKLSTTFVYGSGNTTTLPIGRYFIEGQLINQYGPRNGYRLPAYHRMDVAVTAITRKTKKFYSEVTLSIYNLYNRQNPYFIFFDIEGDITNQNLSLSAKQASLFPILPSIAWNFKF